MKTRFSHAAAFGAGASMAVIALSLLIYLGELSEYMNYLSYLVVITFLWLGARKWREQEGGYLTFGGAYKHLILQSLVYSMIMAVWTYVFVAYIAPGLFESQLAKVEMQMEEQGQSQQAIDMAMEWTRMLMQPGMMAIFALFGGMIIYALLDLVIAAITMKSPPPPTFIPPTGFTDTPFPPQPNQPYGNNPYQQPPSNFPPQS